MRSVPLTDPHRRKHFEHFRRMDQPHFGITAEVDITEFLAAVRRSPTLRFTPAIVYLLTRAAHAVAPLRYRIRGGGVVEHPVVRPSFAVPAPGTGVFGFCTVNYVPDPVAFHRSAEATMARTREEPSFEDEPGADDYLFLSAFPWARFTAVQHAMHYHPEPDSIPRLVWGKYAGLADGSTVMPVAAQAHHAVVDGSDLGAFYRELQQSLRAADEIFSDFL